MKLVRIEFHGFKSFADSADIAFHDGITAIVGPNGCGKSNISDALRWVLGEQRPSAIRGSRMEEAIFQGTERRKPIHRAEVVLQLSNEDRRLPVPYTDVRIARTVHRGGESEYSLNGTSCRLRDIQDLCRDTGLGTNAYAIIEQRMIDAILSDRAEERRTMFEEAAGIGRYKERRRVASRRLDEADTDLARVDDLIGEVEKKVRSLAQQRGRARRYLELRQQKLAVELALAENRMVTLREHIRGIEAESTALNENMVRDSVENRTAQAEYESIRAELADLDRDRADNARSLMSVRDRLSERERERLLAEERGRQARARLDQVESERAQLVGDRERVESELRELRGRAAECRSTVEAVRASLDREEAEVAEVTERRQAMEAAAIAVETERQAELERKTRHRAAQQAAEAEADELSRRLDDLRTERQRLEDSIEAAAVNEEETRTAAAAGGERLNALSAELESARAALAVLEAERDELRVNQAAATERRHATQALIDTLEPSVTGDGRFNPAVRAALERADALGIRGVLSDSVEVEASLAEGLEAYLGPYLEGLVVDDRDAVGRTRRWFLHEYEGPGGLILLPRDRLPAEGPDGSLPAGVRAAGPGAAWLRFLLRDVRSTSSPPDAGDEFDGGRIAPRESVDRQGVHRLGQPYIGAGSLARRAELEQLQERRSALDRELRDLGGRTETHEQELGRRRAEIDRLETDRRTIDEQLARLAGRAEATSERLSRLRREFADLGHAVERLAEDRARALQRAESEERAAAAPPPAEAPQAPSAEELADVRERWERARERVSARRLEEARASAALDRAERELRARQDAADSMADRLERLSGEIGELREVAARSSEEVERAAHELEGLFTEKTGFEEAAGRLDAKVEELRARGDELESLLRRAQQQERERSERRHALELDLSQARSELERTTERLESEWGRPFAELRAEVEPAAGNPGEMAAELPALAERVARMEPVNMLAEQEYQEEHERLEFLRGQREDLARARDDLRETIRRINDRASADLLDTLERIRGNFERTFSTLFEGGECDIWLEDPGDPLDAPIEISASPSGKRTQRIHLLSGGERALTALALLFAIYLVKPSPFCVLDEVDAPLDETNIRRFVAMLEQFKADVQFVVITHNPVTIEAADWIYGVTMEEPGVSKIVGVEFSDLTRGAVA